MASKNPCTARNDASSMPDTTLGVYEVPCRVPGVDALGAVAEVEVLPRDQARALLEDRGRRAPRSSPDTSSTPGSPWPRVGGDAPACGPPPRRGTGWGSRPRSGVGTSMTATSNPAQRPGSWVGSNRPVAERGAQCGVADVLDVGVTGGQALDARPRPGRARRRRSPRRRTHGQGQAHVSLADDDDPPCSAAVRHGRARLIPRHRRRAGTGRHAETGSGSASTASWEVADETAVPDMVEGEQEVPYERGVALEHGVAQGRADRRRTPRRRRSPGPGAG